MSTNKKLTDYNLNDFKHLASTMDKIYKAHRNAARLNQRLMQMCVAQKIPVSECQYQVVPAFQIILEELWKIKYDSKTQLVDAVVDSYAKTDGKKGLPLSITDSDKTAMHALNDMEAQHDQFAAETGANPPLSSNEVKQLYAHSKTLVSKINKNFNNFHETWKKLRDIEKEYIKLYDKFMTLEQGDENKRKLYDDATTRIFPEFRKYNTILDGILTERNTLVDQFYEPYEKLSPEQRASITIPTTAFDAFRQLSNIPGATSPQVSVNECIPKSYADAVKAGFNKTFFASCRVLKQHELLRNCSKKYDYPYIAYAPNLYQPWDPSHSVRELMKSCVKLEQYDRPFIGI